jgi:hypothetical protein
MVMKVKRIVSSARSPCVAARAADLDEAVLLDPGGYGLAQRNRQWSA